MAAAIKDSHIKQGYSEGDLSVTHPRSFDHKHVESLEIFAADLDAALKSSFPLPQYPYSAVYVLLLRWADDDLGVQTEMSRLGALLEHKFRFDVEEWYIPSTSSTRALQTKLYNFQNAHQVENELLIVYYGGHGEADRRGRSIWRANSKNDSPSLPWSSLQPLLETAVPHVLIILDCCFAANAARDTSEGTTKELLAACGRENPTLGVGDRSFTSALIEELQSFGNMPFTVAMLHMRLVSVRWRLAFTPIYALLSEHGGHSITIRPFPENDQSSAPFDKPRDVDTDCMQLSDDDSSSPSLALETRVLLSVSVAEEAPVNVFEWVSWLTNQAPWEVTKIDVRVESVFRSHSTLLLMSIPVFAWAKLPENNAYRFIGFVKSEDLLGERISVKQSKTQDASVQTVINGSYRCLCAKPFIRFPPIDDYSGRRQCLTMFADENAFERHLRENHSAPPYVKEGVKRSKLKRFISIKEAIQRCWIPFDLKLSDRGVPRSDPTYPPIDDPERTATLWIYTPYEPTQSTRSQSYLAMMNQADEGLSTPSKSWTPIEESELLGICRQNLDWSEIANDFPRRTPEACREHFAKLVERGIYVKQENARGDAWRTARFSRSRSYAYMKDEIIKSHSDLVPDKDVGEERAFPAFVS
ncbi:MAG: hypothetical protein Q9190_000026 [Brigantiaea leucoxantha]